MTPAALALSLALAASLDDLGPANDNGQRRDGKHNAEVQRKK